MRRVVLALLILAPTSAVSAQDILEYAVREGETCGVIARRMYGHSRRYDLIHEHNPELGPMPHRLRAGQILRLPQVEVSDRADATVTSVRRRVESQRPQAPDWDRARVGQELYQGWRVSTGERSSAELTFRESSVATIREETLVIVYGGEARRVRREGARAVVREGAVLSRLSALSGGAEPLEVETPTAVARLGEGEHSVHVERQGQTRVASHRGGRARVRTRGTETEVEVPEGHGTFVAEGQPPTPPRRLPAAPAWVPDQPTRYLAIRGRGGRLEGSWQPVSAASRYRVELARREDGRDLLVSTVVPANVTRFELHRLPPGTYFARVCTIDEEGFEGRPPEGKAFTLVGVDVVEPGSEAPAESEVAHPELAALDGVEDVDFVEPTPIEVLQRSTVRARDGVVCAAGDSDPASELVLEALGDVYLTCVDRAGDNIVGLDLTVAALRMQVLGPDGELDPVLPRGRVSAVRVEVAGAALDGVELISGDGLAVVDATAGPGAFAARLRPADGAPAQAELRLVRGGETLATAAVATADAAPDAAPDAPPPRPVQEGLGRAAFASAVGVVDERRRGHAIWMGMHLQSARLGEPDVRLRTTAGLRASFFEERLRVGAQVPLDIVGQAARVADRGERDVQLTAGSLIVDDGAVGLAAEAGLWVPTAGSQAASPGLRHARLQVAGDLSLRFADRLTARTRQALIVDLVGSESALWASAYGLDVWLAGPLSVGLEGTMTLGREDNADWFAGGVGLALGLDVAPVFISLVGRYGFGDDLLTTFTLGTTVRGSFDE